MPRVLKSSFVTIDENNRVKIDVMETMENDDANDDQPDDAYEKINTGSSPETLIDQATKGADLILRNARRNADKILKDAKETAESLARIQEEESRKAGYEAGYAQGLHESLVLKEKAQQMLDENRLQREQLMSAAETDMLALIVKVVNKLLANTININPQAIMVLIRAGLSATTSTGDIAIRVSTHDYDTVLANKNDIAKQIEASSNLEIIKDLSLNKSDCIIETPYGNIDCSLDRQYNSLVENLYHVYSLGE